MENKQNITSEEFISKLFGIDQNKIQYSQIESFIEKKLNKNKINESIKSLLEELEKIIFDPEKDFQDRIKDGQIDPIFTILEIISKNYKKYKINVENFFILIKPLIFMLTKGLEPKRTSEYLNVIIKFLKDKKEIILKNFIVIFEVSIVLKLNTEREVRKSEEDLDKLLKDTLRTEYQESKDKKELDILLEELWKKLIEKIRANHKDIKIYKVSWILILLDMKQPKHIQFLPEILTCLFEINNDKQNDKIGECLDKIKNNINVIFDEDYLKNKELLESILLIIIENCKKNSSGTSNNQDSSKIYAYHWLIEILVKIKSYIAKMQESKNNEDSSIDTNLNKINNNEVAQYNEKDEIILNHIPHNLFDKILSLIFSDPNEENIVSINSIFQFIIKTLPDNSKSFNNKKLEDEIISQFKKNKNCQSKLVIDWCYVLFQKFSYKMFADPLIFIDEFTKCVPNKDYENGIIFDSMINFLYEIANPSSPISSKYVEPVFMKLVNNHLILKEPDYLKINCEKLMVNLSQNFGSVLLYEKICDVLLQIKDIKFIYNMVFKLNNFLIADKKEFKDARNKLMMYKEKENQPFFEKIFSVWSYNPISALILCFISQYFELSFFLIFKFVDVHLEQDYYKQLSLIVQLIENSLYNDIRVKLLEPIKNLYLIKTLYGILMMLPQGEAFTALSKRMKSIEPLLEMENQNYDTGDGVKDNKGEEENRMKEVDKYLEIFDEVQKKIKENYS